MEITLDLSRLYEILNYRPGQLIWFLFINGGWLMLLISILVVLFFIRLFFQRKKFLKEVEFNLLAIDVPKDNEQSLLAVEQIFAQFYGIKSDPNLWEKYWLGKTQLPITLEIISLEGYIQFLIRTPEQFRDLVEATIYAQYPEAEITEVEDYISLIPADVHEIKSDFNIWSTEFSLAKDSAYPIKTYRYFEHGLDQVFIDPMASILEVMSKIGKGEQIGFQLVIAPVNDSWKSRGYHLVSRLIGATVTADEHLGDKIVTTSLNWLEKFSEAIYQLWANVKSEQKKRENLPNLVQYLTSGEKMVVEGIQNKLSKLSFATTFRIYYLAHNEIFKKGRGVNALIGAINQFNTSDLNAFKKHKKLTTDVNYFFVKKRISHRQKKIVKLYKQRSRKGSQEFFVSTEELATLYHFPTITVKAPLLKRTEWRKAVPPTSLPTETARESLFIPTPAAVTATTTPPSPPTTPTESSPAEEQFIIDESLPGYQFDNKYFEEKFTKEQEADQLTRSGQVSKDSAPTNLPIVD